LRFHGVTRIMNRDGGVRADYTLPLLERALAAYRQLARGSSHATVLDGSRGEDSVADLVAGLVRRRAPLETAGMEG
jgi:hypothetical protein